MLRVSEPLEAHRTVVDRTVELARDSSNQPRIARALLARTRHALLKGDLEGAAEDARNALAAVEDLDDRAQLRGRALFRLGETMRQKGDADEGGRHLKRAADLAAQSDDRALERSVLAHLASCEIDVGHTEQAADYLESFDRKAQSENLRRECRAMKRAAYVHYFLGDYGEQQRLNSRALELARDLEDRNLEGLALQGLGDSSFASGDYEEAVEHYREALILHRRLGNEHYAGVLQGNLATALHRLGQLDEARDCYNASLDTHRRTGARPYLATVSFAYGTLLFETDELEPARRKLEESADLYGAIEGKLEDLAATRLTLGLLDLVDSETEKAGEEFQKAAEQFDEAGSEGWYRLATACETIARWHRGDAGLDTARDAFRAVAELESAPECRSIARVLEAPILVDTDDEQADDRIQNARKRDDDSEDLSLCEWSLYGRAATLAAERLVEAKRSRAGRAPTSAAVSVDEADLIVGPEGRWFETDGETTDLRRRGSLRRILATLAERHGHSTEGLEVYDMFDIGWPDQEIEPNSAADRVYWAVRELRKAGLDELLQTTDEGYLLDPGAAVARSERSNPEE
jgi:tetratricopeptide (TPR) repeat protein